MRFCVAALSSPNVIPGLRSTYLAHESAHGPSTCLRTMHSIAGSSTKHSSGGSATGCPRRVAPPPDGTLRVAGAPQKLLPAPPPPPEALLDGFESDEVVEDSRTGGGGWGRGFL